MHVGSRSIMSLALTLPSRRFIRQGRTSMAKSGVCVWGGEQSTHRHSGTERER